MQQFLQFIILKFIYSSTYKIWAIYNSVSRLGSKKFEVVWRSGSQSVYWSRVKHGLYWMEM